MGRFRTSRLAVAFLCIAAHCGAVAEGAGRFNMPTSLSQCLGYGYGAGYHAPLQLAPPWVGGIGPERIQRTVGGRSASFLAPSAFTIPSPGYHFEPSVYVPSLPATQQMTPLHGAPRGY